MRLSLWSLLIFLFLISTAWAELYPAIDRTDVRDEYTSTPDHVDLHMTHLVRPHGKRVVLVHGLGVNGGSFEILATRLWQEGFDVLVVDLRGTYKLPKGMNPFGARNGIKENMQLDMPAVMDYALATATPEQVLAGITVLGHSNGFVAAGGMLTNDKLREKYLPNIRLGIPNQSPQDVAELPFYVKLAAYVGYGPLLALKAMDVVAINMHSKAILYAKQSMQTQDFTGRYVTPAVERFVAFLTSQVFNPKHTRPDVWRRAMMNMPAYSIPIDQLLDYARAILFNKGQYLDPDDPTGKTRLLDPRKYGALPTLVIRAQKDSLAPMKAQQRYYNEISSPYKRLLTLMDFNHTDSVLVTKAESDFYHLIIQAIEAPKEFTSNKLEIVFEPQCQGLLSRFIGR